MKKFSSLLLSIMFLTIAAKAQYVTIPDPDFSYFLQLRYPSCFNSFGMLDTTCSTIANETKLDASGQNFSNIDGIQYFKSLTDFNCSNSIQLTKLTNLPNSLTYLDCSGDIALSNLILPHSLTYLNCSVCYNLKSIPTLPNSLTYLDCSEIHGITSLPNLPNSLAYIDCSWNSLAVLPPLPSTLIYLDCSRTLLTNLPSLPNSLTYLDCSDDSITILPPLSNSLTHLECSRNIFLNSLPTLPPLLDTLSCTQTHITELPTLPVSLSLLECSYNTLGTLPTLPGSLLSLICEGDLLNSLPTLPGSLLSLDCSQNNLTNLPLLPSSLQSLKCPNNKLSSLPPLISLLTFLDCSYNQLTNLPLLPNTIGILRCSYNKLINLPTLPNSLGELDCDNNQLINLPSFPNSLVAIECNNNELTSLPLLPQLLRTLYCDVNQIINLPSLPNSLTFLTCGVNNIYCLPIIPASLQMLTFDTAKIHCIPNLLNNLGGIDLPLCNPTNNPHHCISFPTMNGSAFYDNNSDGIKDSTELYMPYIKMQLSNGSYTFTNTNGYYEIAATDGTGAYTLFATPPHYYKAVAALLNYNFINFDTLVTKNIAMQPTAIVDSLALNVFNTAWHARPGFDLPFIVSYANVGTTTLSPIVTFNYDNTRLMYDSSSNPNIINNGSSLSLSETGFVPGQSNSFTAYFTTKTTDIIGDTIKTSSTIIANAASQAVATATAISGSFDPNDKEATPQLTPEQVTKGKSINYTIRFQNTGNDTAFNIVIADTLSSLLRANTLQMISSSQPCKVTVTGNVVFFEFLNVLLPDNKTNDIGSNGYVSFSIQPQSSVSLGTAINNKAAIYFDYNTPIITNTAFTSIQEPNTSVPVRLISFTALTQSGTFNTLLHWSTASEINTKEFVIEQSTDGINFTTVATVAAKGYGANTYSYTITDNTATYYRLKMVDNNGQYVYSKIVSIKSTQDAEGIAILNNPAVSFVTLKNNIASLNNTIAKIIDSHGAIVKSFVLHLGIQDVNISNLSSGGYYIETLLTSHKFIIAK